jgi:small subunit ribosomal protein S6
MLSTSRYELMILATPEITKEESAEIEKQVSEIVKKRQGSMTTFDRWGKYRLAYPVARNDYGVYFLARFDIVGDEKLNNDFRSMFKIKFDQIVMRNMLTVLAPDASVEYKRPRSLEETPEKESESLLKGKKFEDLISAVKSTEKKEATIEQTYDKEESVETVKASDNK